MSFPIERHIFKKDIEKLCVAFVSEKMTINTDDTQQQVKRVLRKTARPDGIYMDRRGMITHLIMVACAYLLLSIRGLIA